MINRALRTAASAAAVCGLALTGCSLGGGGTEGQSSEESPMPAASPGQLVKVDGFWTDPAIGRPLADMVLEVPQLQAENKDYMARGRFQVLSIDKKGDTARLVGAWLQPAEGPALGSMSLGGGVDVLNKEPRITLWDVDSGTLIKPLQTEKSDRFDKPVSNLYQSMTEETPANRDKPVELFWVDFPAPSGNSVRVLPGPWTPPTDPVQVTEGKTYVKEAVDENAKFSDEPPADYGDESALRYVDSLVNTTEMDPNSSLSRFEGGEALNIDADVLFDFDKDIVNAKGKKVLDSTAQKLKEGASGQEIALVGHTDAKGSADYNKKLSQRRADAVKKYLDPKVEGADITFKTEGRGADEPLAPNFDAKGGDIKANQAKNRRVSFEFRDGSVSGGVSTGQPEKKIPAVEKTEPADGALASAVLKVEGAAVGPVRLDIRGISEDGPYTRFDFGFAAQNPDDASITFFLEPRDSKRVFGLNSYGQIGSPSADHMALVDDEGKVVKPAQAGGHSCLCSSASPTNVSAGNTPAPLYAMFPTDSLPQGKFKLRIAETGEWELDLDELKQKAEEQRN